MKEKKSFSSLPSFALLCFGEGKKEERGKVERTLIQTGEVEGSGGSEGGVDDGGIVEISLEGSRDCAGREAETELALGVLSMDDDVVRVEDAGLSKGQKTADGKEEHRVRLHFLPSFSFVVFFRVADEGNGLVLPLRVVFVSFFFFRGTASLAKQN